MKERMMTSINIPNISLRYLDVEIKDKNITGVYEDVKGIYIRLTTVDDQDDSQYYLFQSTKTKDLHLFSEQGTELGLYDREVFSLHIHCY